MEQDEHKKKKKKKKKKNTYKIIFGKNKHSIHAEKDLEQEIWNLRICNMFFNHLHP